MLNWGEGNISLSSSSNYVFGEGGVVGKLLAVVLRNLSFDLLLVLLLL